MQTRKLVILLAFLAVLIDGFDTAIISILVPYLADDWHLHPSAFTYPLVLNSFGVVVGYILCGYVARKIGPRNILIIGTLLFGLTTIASAATLELQSVVMLSVTRALTGIGLGMVLPTAVVVGTHNGPAAKKQAISVLVTMGVITGSTVAGFSGAVLIRGIGSAGTLWVTGIAPLVLGTLMWFVVPPSRREARRDESSGKSAVVTILGRDLRTSTLVLWSATFLVFATTYTLKSWLPTLFRDYGLAKDIAGLGLAFYSLGGVVGGLVLIPISARFGGVRSLVGTSLLGAVAVMCVALLSSGTTVLMLMTFCAGLGITACTIGQVAIAVELYREAMQVTGVGWSVAAGRIGSIIGPAFAGVLLGLAWPAKDVVLVLGTPVLVTTGCWFYLARKIPSADGRKGDGRAVRAGPH